MAAPHNNHFTIKRLSSQYVDFLRHDGQCIKAVRKSDMFPHYR
jgi:hypothetical protein